MSPGRRIVAIRGNVSRGAPPQFDHSCRVGDCVGPVVFPRRIVPRDKKTRVAVVRQLEVMVGDPVPIIGWTLGHYKVLEKIGAGGMGRGLSGRGRHASTGRWPSNSCRRSWPMTRIAARGSRGKPRRSPRSITPTSSPSMRSKRPTASISSRWSWCEGARSPSCCRRRASPSASSSRSPFRSPMRSRPRTRKGSRIGM